MKNITLKSIELTNFKGIRSLKVNFNDKKTIISGCNGIGKSTIFDAFTWVLFGKNSHDEKQFGIKTFDENGKIIPKIPHEVTAVLLIDGNEVKLTKRFVEKWTKRRGSAEEIFTGNEEERLYCDVPLSMREWNSRIAEICTEEVFKYITNPLYFCSQKPDVQRSMLFRIAGEISDEEIAATNAEFALFLNELSGRTIEEYKRSIAAKKKALKAEADGIPERIDERQRDNANSGGIDFTELESKEKEIKDKIADVEKQILDKSKNVEAQSNEQVEREKEISELRLSLQQRKSEIENDLLKDYYDQKKKQVELTNENDTLEQQIKTKRTFLETTKTEISTTKTELELLRNQWKEIKSRTLTFDENDFVCPTCKRPFDVNEVQAKQESLTQAFNEQKAKDFAANNQKGLETKTKLEKLQKQYDDTDVEFTVLQQKQKDLKANPLFSLKLVPASKEEIDATLSADKKYQNIEGQIKKLEEKQDSKVTPATDDDLLRQKRELINELTQIQNKLSLKQSMERNNDRINELKKQMTTLNEEIAQIEKREYLIQEFNTLKIQTIENKINSLFTTIKFKMFKDLINGGQEETCEAIVNGVPYSDLNSAGRINAGLEIINVISNHAMTHAPIFIDNAESVNTIMPTDAQQVHLKVTEDNNLTIN